MSFGFPFRNARIDTQQDAEFIDAEKAKGGDEYQRNEYGGSDNVRKPERSELGHVIQPPFPGDESAGPALFDLIRETRRAAEASRFLVTEASALLQRRRVVEKGQATVDAAGNLDVVMYQVPVGFELMLTRVVVESGNSSPAGGYTNAAAWIAVIVGDKFGLGSILEFAPNPPTAAGGFILPWMFGQGSDDIGFIRGPQNVGLHITGGVALASVMISFRLHGQLSAV